MMFLEDLLLRNELIEVAEYEIVGETFKESESSNVVEVVLSSMICALVEMEGCGEYGI